MTTHETVVFQTGNSVAMRLLGSCRLPRGTRIRQWREGDRIVIETFQGTWPEIVRDVAGSWDRPLPRIEAPA